MNWFNNTYPSGETEFIDLARNQECKFDFLHFIKKYINLEGQDLMEYKEVCNIKNSDIIWYSRNIRGSNIVTYSSDVKESNNVFSSSQVINSDWVFNSRVIAGSTDVAYSNDISSSEFIIKSSNVKDSSQVLSSTLINWSNHITNSTNIRDSSYIYCSDNISNSAMCGFIHNSRNCMFCFNKQGLEYCMFNQPVSPSVFEEVYETLLAKLEDENVQFITEGKGIVTNPEIKYNYSNRFDAIFNGLSEDFYGWVGTLPNYSEDVFLDLMFRNRK